MNLLELKQKLVLGTVQLGLPYGINNMTGVPDEHEASRILDKAASEQIRLLDSADAYGTALKVIGNYLKKNRSSSFEIISKFIGDEESLVAKVDRTLAETERESLYAYMYHRFPDYQSRRYRQELLHLQETGKVERIGVSIYSLMELETCVGDPDISVIQLPLNALDAAPDKMDMLTRAKDSGKEIHVRSVFLQGLFFKDPRELTGNLKGFSEALEKIKTLASQYKVSVREICLNFALRQPQVDHVVIGVETLKQLEENLQSIVPELPGDLFENLKSISDVNPELLNPSEWKP